MRARIARAETTQGSGLFCCARVSPAEPIPAPHCWQNLAAGVRGAPQDGHLASARGVPQEVQNLAPGLTGAEQDGHLSDTGISVEFICMEI